MNAKTFDGLREVIYERSGITLGPNKEALVTSRLGKRLRALDCPDYETYLDLVVRDAAGDEVVHMLDAISTNVTSFFREQAHFDYLRAAASEWGREGRRAIRIWSAASSTGEEPYTIAMTMAETEELRGADIRILATDISTRVLGRAHKGVFTEDRVKPVPPAMRAKWLEKAGPGLVRVADPLRRMTTFKRLNLSRPPFPMKGPFDAVFCRNVMIYFDDRVRKGLLDEIARLLRPGGYLMVGHAESLAGQTCGLTTIAPAIYRK